MGSNTGSELPKWCIEVSCICRALYLMTLISDSSSVSYYFNLKGSVIDGVFVPISAPSAGSCPSSGIQYPLKSGTPVPTSTPSSSSSSSSSSGSSSTSTPSSSSSSSGSSTSTPSSSSVGLFSIHFKCQLMIANTLVLLLTHWFQCSH